MLIKNSAFVFTEETQSLRHRNVG